MKPENTYFVVMYDITYPKSLQKVNVLLKETGLERVNYSVWVGWVNPLKIPELKEKLKRLLKKPEAIGSLFYVLPVSRSDLKKMRGLNGRKPKELNYWLGEESTLFF